MAETTRTVPHAIEEKSRRQPLPIGERRALSYPDAVDYSGLSQVTLWRRAREGKLKILKVGGRALIDRASLDAMLDNAASAAA